MTKYISRRNMVKMGLALAVGSWSSRIFGHSSSKAGCPHVHSNGTWKCTSSNGCIPSESVYNSMGTLSVKELASVSKVPSCKVVYQMGYEADMPEIYEYIANLTSVAPVYVHASNPIENLSTQHLAEILAGQSRTWAIGPSRSSEVTLVTNGKDRYRKRLGKLLEKNCLPKLSEGKMDLLFHQEAFIQADEFGYEDSEPYNKTLENIVLPLGRVNGVGVREFAGYGYEAMSHYAEKNPNCLVLGLRETVSPQLKCIRIDGFHPLEKQYPLFDNMRVLGRLESLKESKVLFNKEGSFFQKNAIMETT